MTVFADTAAAFSWMESFTNLEKIRNMRQRQHYRLDRMRYLLELFGNPHLEPEVVHVAGTKGKGSTAAMIARVLHEAGRRVGLYTSPHVQSYTERIGVGDGAADSAILLDAAEDIRAAVESIRPGTLPVDETPTTFELLTLLAFMVFHRSGCDTVVAEVGIGGRLDCTNVVSPEACAITPIEMEHADVLGDTIEEIAAEKAGIIKPGVPVYSAAQSPPVRQVLEETARTCQAPLLFVDDQIPIRHVEVTPAGTWCRLADGGRDISFDLKLPGVFQAENAALAYLTLSRTFRDLPPDCMARGFARATLAGRMEVLRSRTSGRWVVLDGAHTPISVARAAESFLRMFPGGGVLVFGSVAGKNHEEMAAILAPLFSAVVVSTPNAFKESNPRQVRQSFNRHMDTCLLEPAPCAALRTACELAEGDQAVFVTGSFYMISEIRACSDLSTSSA